MNARAKGKWQGQGGEANFANFRDLMIHRKLTSHPVSKIGEQLAQWVARWTLGSLWFLLSCDHHWHAIAYLEYQRCYKVTGLSILADILAKQKCLVQFWWHFPGSFVQCHGECVAIFNTCADQTFASRDSWFSVIVNLNSLWCVKYNEENASSNSLDC